MSFTKFVRIYEVGPRDGLQNEKQIIPSADKIKLVDLLSETGLRHIEVCSFVSPQWVPQMADAKAVMSNIKKYPGVRYSALTPNMKGYRDARACGVDEVAVFASASETFSKKNINCTIEESLKHFKPFIQVAKDEGVLVRGYISCIVDCPYEGAVSPESVARLTLTLLEMGCYEVSLGDTTGAGTPETIRRMLREVLSMAPANQLSGHYHDTNGLALSNIEASLDAGLRSFDSAVGGLGGCPYAPGAQGNVATGAVVRRLHSLGWQTGVDLVALAKAEALISKIKANRKAVK